MPNPEFEWSDLSLQELRGIARIRQGEADMLDPKTLPLINEATVANTNSYYGISDTILNANTADAAWKTGEIIVNDFYQNIAFANPRDDETLGDIFEAVFQRFFNKDVGHMNGASIGAGYVLCNFRNQIGDSFLERLQKVQFDDAAKAACESLMVGKNFINFSERDSIFKRGKLRMNVPTYQQHLRHGISILQQVAACQPCVVFGATSIYNTLDAVWEKMNIPMLKLPAATPTN